MPTMFRQWNKNKKLRLAFSIAAIILSAFLQVYIMQVFMNPCGLISGGFTGIALFATKLFGLAGINFPTSAGILCLNIPAAIFCTKHISKRFVFLSTLQFVLVSVFLQLFSFTPLVDDQVLNILFGGVGWGFAIAIALRAGGSTGGTDFIAQYISSKLHKSIFDYVFYFNCAMYVVYGFIFGWIHAGYSILFQFLSTKAISTLYQRYSQITVQFTTVDPDAVTDAFLATCRHGMSIIEASGAFSGRRYYICSSVISSYELNEVVENVRKVDPNVIINAFKTASFYGNFYQAPLE